VFRPLALRAINREREERGEEPFANPRNSAAGTIKTLDTRVVAARGLDVYLYSVAHVQGATLRGQWEALERLRGWGLKTNETSRLCHGLDEVLAFIADWQDKRDTLEYEIDGVVVKVDSFALQQELASRRSSALGDRLQVPRGRPAVVREIVATSGAREDHAGGAPRARQLGGVTVGAGRCITKKRWLGRTCGWGTRC
jgi:DNA ligase (NAD+)